MELAGLYKLHLYFYSLGAGPDAGLKKTLHRVPKTEIRNSHLFGIFELPERLLLSSAD